MGHPFILPGHLRCFTNHLIRAIQSGAVRQLKVDHQITLVLLGNKTHGHSLEAENREPHQSAIYQKGQNANANQTTDNSAIAIDRDVESPVESTEKESQESIDQARDQPAHHKTDGENPGAKGP